MTDFIGDGASVVLPAVLRGRNVAVVDVEGNGQQPPEIIELSMLPFGVGSTVAVADIRTWLIRPVRPITAIVARKVHGIDNRDVETCPSWSAVAPDIEQSLAGRVLVAHNASVEQRIIGAHLPGWHPPLVLDTLRTAKVVWPGLAGGYGLDALSAHASLQGPPPPAGVTPSAPHRTAASSRPRHRAGFDTWVTGQLLCILADEIGDWGRLVEVARFVGTSGRLDPGAPQEETLW